MPVPLTVLSQSTSHAVMISVAAGRGSCVDPPSASEALVTAVRSTILNEPVPTAVDLLVAIIDSAPGKTRTPFIPESAACAASPRRCSWAVGGPSGPLCPIPGYLALDSGSLSVSNAAGAQFVAGPAGLRDGVKLPAGFSVTGLLRITGTGGKDVGPFATNVALGQGIQVTSSFPRGSQIGWSQVPAIITVNWTGGESPASWLR